MTMMQTIDRGTAEASSPEAAARLPVADDRAMLRAAADLTRDISLARGAIYWPDMLGSAVLGYAALAGAILVDSTWLALACATVAVFALYRALLFIHELTHIHKKALPGFRTAWNLAIGIPLLTPSFMYEGVHTLHHARTRYGTADDPEYLPLALMKPWTLPLFVVVSLLAPAALIVRFGILAPLGPLIPAVRRMNWEKFSSLSINPAFRRRAAERADVKRFAWLEAGASAWAIVLIGSVFVLGPRPLLIAIAVLGVVALLNQLRTLVAHLWENEGEAMSVTAQYLDSVNVPPPSPLAALWAPVGLRYHATHHLLPSLPYHSLGEAHRRLSAHLAPETTYWRASHKGMSPLVWRILSSTLGRRA